jgi:hypothetical protein
MKEQISTMSKQQRRTFTTEFKKQMVQLYENGVQSRNCGGIPPHRFGFRPLDQAIEGNRLRTIVRLKKMSLSPYEKKTSVS